MDSPKYVYVQATRRNEPRTKRENKMSLTQEQQNEVLVNAYLQIANERKIKAEIVQFVMRYQSHLLRRYIKYTSLVNEQHFRYAMARIEEMFGFDIHEVISNVNSSNVS